MENRFAKLFDLEGAQVLYTKSSEDEDEETPFKLTIRTDYMGISATYKLSFTDEETRDEQFDGLTVKAAQVALDGLKDMMKD